jgi:hypothetical protein
VSRSTPLERGEDQALVTEALQPTFTSANSTDRSAAPGCLEFDSLRQIVRERRKRQAQAFNRPNLNLWPRLRISGRFTRFGSWSRIS